MRWAARDSSIDADSRHKRLAAELERNAPLPVTGRLDEYLEKVRLIHEQIIDRNTLDEVEAEQWSKELIQELNEVLSG